MFARVNCRLNNHVVAVFWPHKNVGNCLPQLACSHNARFHAVTAKQLNFLQQIFVGEQRRISLNNFMRKNVQTCKKEKYFQKASNSPPPLRIATPRKSFSFDNWKFLQLRHANLQQFGLHLPSAVSQPHKQKNIFAFLWNFLFVFISTIW